jgi:uncharacterized oxidoreductase
LFSGCFNARFLLGCEPAPFVPRRPGFFGLLLGSLLRGLRFGRFHLRGRFVQQFVNQANKAVENIIVNVTSEVALFPIPILALYATSKAGFSVFTKVLRQQLKNTTFKVVEILPPQVETEMPKQIGNRAKGVNANDYAKKIISTVNRGKKELANGSNVPLLKLFSKFLPNVGLNLIDKMSRKQIQVQ